MKIGPARNSSTMTVWEKRFEEAAQSSSEWYKLIGPHLGQIERRVELVVELLGSGGVVGWRDRDVRVREDGHRSRVRTNPGN